MNEGDYASAKSGGYHVDWTSLGLPRYPPEPVGHCILPVYNTNRDMTNFADPTGQVLLMKPYAKSSSLLSMVSLTRKSNVVFHLSSFDIWSNWNSLSANFS